MPLFTLDYMSGQPLDCIKGIRQGNVFCQNFTFHYLPLGYKAQLNPFPNKPCFLRVCSTSLLKTLCEKEKLLVTSNFSFSHSIFYPF